MTDHAILLGLLIALVGIAYALHEFEKGIRAQLEALAHELTALREELSGFRSDMRKMPLRGLDDRSEVDDDEADDQPGACVGPTT